MYEARFVEPVPDLAARVARLLAQVQVLRERRGRTYDLRPLILALDVLSPHPDEPAPRLRMTLAARPRATGRPDEVLAALELDPAVARVERLHRVLNDTSSALDVASTVD